jgi:heme/copper-type cytochrome/quinol oxidase subunit 1
MIFFLIMPTLIGAFGNILTIIYISANEVIYPRINNIALVILVISLNIIINVIYIEYGNLSGWTFYPPLSILSNNLYNISIDIMVIVILVNGISSTLTIINFIVTINIWK